MAYFHSRLVRSRGGLRQRLMKRVVGESIEEMTSIARLWPDQTAINLPPRGKECHKSKSLPMLWVDSERMDILEQIGSESVSEEHILVLTWMLRREWYETRSGIGMPEDIARFFELEIRGNLIKLLRSGNWIDDPESQSLKNLNQRLEKIDLGRRSDLKFSSVQSETKYNPDTSRYGHLMSPSVRKIVPPVEDDSDIGPNEIAYRDGNAEQRAALLEEMPFLAYLKSKYPD